jgi:SRSO17 transposase
MNLQLLKSTQEELLNLIEEFKPYLGRIERRRQCFMYLSGLLLEGERKSMQPMAERLPGSNYQALQQFISSSPWDYKAVQKYLSHYLFDKLKIAGGYFVLDDVALPKKGEESVGVAPQYCGILGKVANCQAIVSWHYATQHVHFPLMGQLYLPSSWTMNKKKLKKAHVPIENRSFKTKWEIALDLLEDIKDLPHEVILIDAGYGEIRPFLRCLDEREEIFFGQIPESHCFWDINVPIENSPNLIGQPRRYPCIANKTLKPLSAKEWKNKLLKEGKKFRTITLGHSFKNEGKFLRIRVREVIGEAYYRPGPERWLIIEQLDNGDFKYFVSNATRRTSLKKLASWSHSRWKIDQGYQRLKEEVGLDHFEGRSWISLHHHLTLCFMAYAFLLILQQKNQKKMAA